MTGAAAALGSAASWALGAILYKRLGAKAPASGMNLAKSLLALAILSAALLALGARWPGLKTFSILSLSGLLGIALGDTFFFLSLQELAAHVVVVLCAAGQAVTVLLAVLFLGERPSPAAWGGIALIVAGISVVLAGQRSPGLGKTSARGVALGLMAVACMSTAVIVAKVGLEQVSALEGAVIRMAGAVAGLAFWGAASRSLDAWTSPFREPALLHELAFAVCVSSLGGFWLFHVALKTMAASTANTLGSTEPLFVLPLAAILLNERVTRASVLGALVSIGGIALLSARG